MDGQRAVNSISGTWSQQAEKAATESDLFKGKTDTKATPRGSLSQRHRVPSRHLTPSSFLSTKG